AAGPDLTPESLTAAMESIEVPNIFTGDVISFGEGGRTGSSAVYLSQIQGGQWSFVEKLRD
ncbi:MAG: branched-chain amino acid ABC transporter substrate-binding protein, partial [Pseudomonadota bacterium]|nr:branched-chain amino acid ABC transporter substrate-binding protein [Pseudomonadota bacterium]